MALFEVIETNSKLQLSSKVCGGMGYVKFQASQVLIAGLSSALDPRFARNKPCLNAKKTRKSRAECRTRIARFSHDYCRENNLRLSIRRAAAKVTLIQHGRPSFPTINIV